MLFTDLVQQIFPKREKNQTMDKIDSHFKFLNPSWSIDAILPMVVAIEKEQISSNSIKLNQMGSNWIKRDQIGSSRIKSDETGSNLFWLIFRYPVGWKKKNCIKLGLIDLPKFGGGGLSPNPALPYPFSCYLWLLGNLA